MADFEHGSTPERRLLPFVGAPVIDALRQDLFERFDRGDAEGFIHDNIGVMNTENPGVALILGRVAESIADDDELSPGAKMLVSGIIVYRLLRNQAEAIYMNTAMGLAAEPDESSAEQAEVDAAKETAALARSLSLDLLEAKGLAIPSGVDAVRVELIRTIHDPNSVYSTSTYPDSHTLAITASGVDPSREQEQRPHKFALRAKGSVGSLIRGWQSVDGWVSDDGTFDAPDWRSIEHDVFELRDALRAFSKLPGQFAVNVSMQLQAAESVVDPAITNAVFPED
jgi:hypothetical protein